MAYYDIHDEEVR